MRLRPALRVCVKKKKVPLSLFLEAWLFYDPPLKIHHAKNTHFINAEQKKRLSSKNSFVLLFSWWTFLPVSFVGFVKYIVPKVLLLINREKEV